MSKALVGGSLVFLGVYLNIPFSILAVIFEYPQILRQPTGEILTLFSEGGPALIAVWYAFALAAIFMIVVVLLVHDVLKDRNRGLLRVATVFGILAGLLQTLGLIRWVFVVPSLAQAFADPAATEASRAAVVVVFNALHQYAGVALGEHLGQLFTAVWAALISFSLPRTNRVLSTCGKAAAIVMALGLIEGFATVTPFDAGLLAMLTPLAFIGLSIWMIAFGVSMLRNNV